MFLWECGNQPEGVFGGDDCGYGLFDVVDRDRFGELFDWIG